MADTPLPPGFDGQKMEQAMRAFMKALAEPQRAVEGSERTDHDTGERAPEALRSTELVADDGELGERGVQDRLLPVGLAAQDQAQDRGAQQHQREDRDEGVVGQRRREVGTLVVEVLVDHRQGEAEDGVAALERVD